jgi:hypothetical protein
MNRIASISLVLTLLCLAACEPNPPAEIETEDPNGATFVTLLGSDTLVVEQFRRTAEGIEADVVLRTPETTVRHYRLDLDEAGHLTRYEATEEDATEVITPVGDSLEVAITEGDSTETRMVAGDAQALPFIDMVHWPFELMLMRAVGQDSVTQGLFTGRGTMPFVVRTTGEGTMTVAHPFRGTMEVEVDEEGRLQRLDAGETTRKLIVTRVPSFDTDAFAERSAAKDAVGEAFGPLSGRGETMAQVDGATINVDYGQPAKRGREVFGALVPWDERWRTGANRATHFQTDRALSFGDVTMPAGQYTLYTIPNPDGGTLIINQQTGQGGTTYNEDQDLGRVPMTLTTLDQTVELFTIEMIDTDEGGELQLQWDETAFVIPFTVDG